jgi:hypothetical protein
MSLALVLGCGECVWHDAARFYEMATPDAVIAVKDMILLWPLRVDYGVNLHPERSIGYMRERAKLKRNTDFEVWAHKSLTSTLPHRVTTDWQGSTGLLAVKIALEEGFDGVVLAGVPMEPSAGHVVRHKAWQSAQMFRKGWKVHFGEIESKVKSMSGWTMDLLGTPTTEWLQKLSAAPADHEVACVLKETGDASTQSGSREARRAS